MEKEKTNGRNIKKNPWDPTRPHKGGNGLKKAIYK